jgi:hypothetical protein
MDPGKTLCRAKPGLLIFKTFSKVGSQAEILYIRKNHIITDWTARPTVEVQENYH